MFTIVRDIWDSRFLWLELPLNLGSRIHLHVKRAAVTTCFTEIMCWKEDVKLRRPSAFSNRKDCVREGLSGDLEKKQMELMVFSHILGHNGNDGIWQRFTLMGSSWALSVLSVVRSSILVPHSSD